ncbi:TetR family transcriptional regulator [Mycobacterium hodleri]|uniref:TetR family transcriptional regulator n=2 Tax=Mycolicibacterium hodleri TaxID=49897 RepID=A0A502E3Y4_9MYCO|nr:TetR family transcriptional regulator [Mycolicibacterium hodleri]
MSQRAAHRPSRRDEIVAAAVTVFAEHGFVGASMQDIADAAKVVVSGVYYHFETKTQLFDAATTAVYESLDAAVEAARVEGANRGSREALAAAIRAAYRWADDHPDASKMLYSHLPGATPESARLRDRHEARHVAAADRYLEEAARSGSDAAADSAAGELAARTLVHLMLTAMPLRLEGGLFSKRSAQSLEASLQAVGIQTVFADG